MAEISLNASMRSNLLSLQQTQRLQDTTQSRLSSGLKVNSAIDNPSSYYTASSLNNRAEDLGALLDAMSQGIQTIKAANEALETGTAILQQAKATAVKASESSVDIVAKVKNEAELLAAVEKGGPGYIVITSDIHLTNEVKLKDGQKLVGDNYFAEFNGANRKLSFDSPNDAVLGIALSNNSLVSNLDLEVNTTGKTRVSYAAVKADNVKNVEISNLNIKILDDVTSISRTQNTAIHLSGGSSTVSITGNVNIDNQYKSYRGYGIRSDSIGLEIKDNLNIKTVSANGYGLVGSFNIAEEANVNIHTSGNVAYGIYASMQQKFNIEGKVNIFSEKSAGIMLQSGSTGTIGSKAQVYIQSNLTPIALELTVAGYKPVSFSIQQGALLAIKDNANPGGVFSRLNSEYVYNSNITNGLIITSNTLKTNAQFDTTITPWTPFDFSTMILNQTFTGNEKADKKPDDKSYSEIIKQYDQLINDASYKGVNLLENNNLKVNFNEERSSGLEVKGVDASGKALGLNTKGWESKMDVLTEGADKLTLADMNAESANMLALQTRQQLAINSLSLASQAAQSVLKLF